MDFTWNVLADFEVEQIINGNQITLCVDDEKVIGKSFVLQKTIRKRVALYVRLILQRK